MAQVIPQSDTFDDTATPVDGWHCGYQRLLPWGAGAEGATGDSLVSTVGDLNSAYSATPGSPTRASIINLGTPGTGVSHFAWSKAYLANAEARMGIIWKPAPSLGVTGFRYAMVGVRIAGQSINDGVPGFERLENGDGYWLELRNTASANTAKWILLRINAGTVTKLTESAAFDISVLNLQAGIVIGLRATTVSGNVVLRCQRGQVGRYVMDDPNMLDVFGGDITDSSGSKLTAAGRCGICTTQPPLGGAPLFTSFQIRNVDSDTVVFRDEFSRVNLLVGGSVGPDQNTVAGRNLMPYFGGSIGGYNGVNRRLARDAGNGRMRNDPGGGVGWDCPMAFAATHPSIQRRYGRVTFTTPNGQNDTWMIELRGTALHGITAPFGFSGACYRAELKCTDGTTFDAILVCCQGGVRTVLASKTLSGLSTGTAIKFELETVNTGGATPLLGTPNLVVRVNDVVVSGWTSAGVPGIQFPSTGAVLDTRSVAIRSGSEQGHRHTRGSLTVGTIFLDDWTDAATLPSAPESDLSQILVASETASFSGQTLTVPIDWDVEQIPGDPGIWHDYDSDHRQALKTKTRSRRRWRVRNKAAKPAEEEALLAFYAAHKGVKTWFEWNTDDGDVARVHFTTTDLEHRMRDRGVRAFEFELEEGFLL